MTDPKPSGAQGADARQAAGLSQRLARAAGGLAAAAAVLGLVGGLAVSRLAPGALLPTLVLAALGLAALAWGVVHRLAAQTVAPLAELEQLADQAARGQPVELSPALRRDDDIGRLAARLKAMADSLQQGHAAMTAQVQEQTAARKAAQQASIAKTEFLATMSHEIRTPMNAILGLSYLALQGPLDERQRDYISKTHGAAENLLGIINGILDFSKVEAGQMQLEREPFVLQQVLDRVAGTAGVKAQAKGLELRVEVEPLVPQELIGDALRLGQVLLNLCDNAIKFTEQGLVLITVESVLQLGKEVELCFCVGDTGAGIPTAKQKTIFDAFSQADASTTRRHGGTGLGLAISKRLVDMMGGHLGVSSQVGSGSTFHFNARFGAVPPALAAADDPQDGFRSNEALFTGLRGAKVLLAEDNELNQLLARELLERAGIAVIVAADGREALEALRAHPDTDLVLMDCQMPVMDGFAATRAIRSDRRFRKLPVLAMTANVLPEDLASCRGAGMNDHIGKPIDVDELYVVLSRWLDDGAVPSGPVPLAAH